MNFLKKATKSLGGGSSSKSSAPSGSFEGRTFLHGHLMIEVKSAKNLPDLEGWVSKLVDKKDVTDPFVDIRLGKARIAKTAVVNNNLNPEWNEDYRVEVCHFAEELVFEVRDKDHAVTEFIGSVTIPTPSLLSGEVREGPFPIKKKSGSHNGQLTIRVEFVSKDSVARSYDVPSYFPMQRNCRVVPYMDAHCPPDLPKFADLKRPDGRPYVPQSCWTDLYHSIMGAKHLICITGWSVWDKLQLFRGRDLAVDNRTLGELLIEKANEGVKVYVMVWSEKTSGDIIGEKGVMGTHDMETFNRFKNTKVHCALAPRELSIHEFTDVLQNEFSSGAYTHHQKSVIVDAENPAGRLRRLVAFVGGLDLTGGRYDTPEFPLFKTLLNEHYGDFRNSYAKSVPPEQGPREPWHDIHSRVEGPIAHDIFINFYERWSKQGVKYAMLDMIDSSLIDIMAPAPVADPSEDWNVQLFRSITSDSAIFNPEKLRILNGKKGRMVDASIAQSYIQTIRNAQNFLYFENQYFLGSAYSWLQNDDVNCHHTIPSEIAQKVVNKIFAGERFTAYIVIPMFPEGDPSSAPIQEILYWQTRTIEMMYRRVGDAIRTAGLDSHPTDWLLFLCPGKREMAGPHLDQLEPPTEAMAKTFRQTLRMPIYVHCKMMIADDAYIIIGSANINQRSMAGSRDTEMAVGCWQPSFPESNPYGDVHMFRLALFVSHFCVNDPTFRYPGTIECVQKVKEMAYYNWQMYNGPEGSHTPGQMLPYPLNVLQDGSIEILDGVATFPDFPPGSKIMGKRSAMIPQKVTT